MATGNQVENHLSVLTLSLSVCVFVCVCIVAMILTCTLRDYLEKYEPYYSTF